MTERSLDLYCPDCHQKVWTISDKSTGNYSSIPGIRRCRLCNQLIKAEDCWRTSYHPDPHGDRHRIKTSEISFRIPIKVSYSVGPTVIKVPTELGSIEIKIPKLDSRRMKFS